MPAEAARPSAVALVWPDPTDTLDTAPFAVAVLRVRPAPVKTDVDVLEERVIARVSAERFASPVAAARAKAFARVVPAPENMPVAAPRTNAVARVFPPPPKIPVPTATLREMARVYPMIDVVVLGTNVTVVPVENVEGF